MKLPSSDIHTETNLNTKEYQFKIDENDQGIIFEMLRSKIYKDPIGSICREVASNSRDAHREVNKRNLPIEITINSKNILNNGSMTIEFKDYGTGISEDRMENIFCKYAASTKRDTNTMTGGFGLGAKTPFSYSDIFYIKTIYDNILYTYTAYIDESKKGKITLHKKVESNESNSTSIIVPIKNNNDRHEFEKKCKLYTQNWDVKPIYKNFNSQYNEINYEELYKGDNYILIKRLSHLGPIALIDGIPYNVDIDVDNSLFRNSLNYNTPATVMYFKNGELDISINRENLQYTKRTINALNKRFKKIKDELIVLFEKHLASSTNLLEATYRLRKVQSSGHSEFGSIYQWLVFYNSNNKLDLKYKNKSINTNLVFSNIRCNEYVKHSYQNNIFCDKIYGSVIDSLYNKEIYLLPEGKTTKREINEQIIKNNNGKSFVLVGKRKYNKRKPKTNDLTSKEWINYLDNKRKFDNSQDIELVKLKELGKEVKDYFSVKVNKDTSGERNIPSFVHVKIYERKSYRTGYVWNKLELSKDQIINHKKKYAYVLIDKADSISKIDNKKTIDNFIACKYHNRELICITKRQLVYFKGFDKVEDLAKSVDKTYITKVIDYIKLQELKREYENSGYKDYSYNKEIEKTIDIAIKKYDEYSKIDNIKRLINYKDFIEQSSIIKPSDFVNNFNNTIELIPKKYPLITFITRWKKDKHIIDDANLYIKCKDEQK